MENVSIAIPAYGIAPHMSTSAASVRTVAVVETLRERGMAGIAVWGKGELCPATGLTVRDAAFPTPLPGTAVSDGPPV